VQSIRECGYGVAAGFADAEELRFLARSWHPRVVAPGAPIPLLDGNLRVVAAGEVVVVRQFESGGASGGDGRAAPGGAGGGVAGGRCCKRAGGLASSSHDVSRAAAIADAKKGVR
jgi:hypothetical protein